MYFFYSFSYIFIFIFIFLYNINIFSGCCGNEPIELEKEPLEAYITLDKVEPMNIKDKNKKFYYMLLKENVDTKKEDISVTISKNIVDNDNKLKNVDTEFKLECDDKILEGLRIICIAKDYYIIFYSANVSGSNNKVEEKLFCLQKDTLNNTLSFDENIYLTKQNLEKDIKTINDEGNVDGFNYILKIKSLSGLKIVKTPVKLDLK